MDRSEREAAWREDGFFVLRGAIPEHEARRVEAEVIERIRNDPPDGHRGEAGYFAGPDLYIVPETSPGEGARAPEDSVSRVFNCHAEGAASDVARRAVLVDILEDLLGPDIDCFQSQFIFKNPGVIGQPWHQDSYYFTFDRQPQVGVWLALSRANVDNGCLWVVPGSHRSGRIFEHVPDRRPQANLGYLEIVDQDVSDRIPVVIKPGDVLFFHSGLMHMSTDKFADYRRSAMVYHYSRAKALIARPDYDADLALVNRWMPVRRGGAPARAEVGQ